MAPFIGAFIEDIFEEDLPILSYTHLRTHYVQEIKRLFNKIDKGIRNPILQEQIDEKSQKVEKIIISFESNSERLSQIPETASLDMEKFEKELAISMYNDYEMRSMESHFSYLTRLYESITYPEKGISKVESGLNEFNLRQHISDNELRLFENFIKDLLNKIIEVIPEVGRNFDFNKADHIRKIRNEKLSVAFKKVAFCLVDNAVQNKSKLEFEKDLLSSLESWIRPLRQVLDPTSRMIFYKCFEKYFYDLLVSFLPVNNPHFINLDLRNYFIEEFHTLLNECDKVGALEASETVNNLNLPLHLVQESEKDECNNILYNIDCLAKVYHSPEAIIERGLKEFCPGKKLSDAQKILLSDFIKTLLTEIAQIIPEAELKFERDRLQELKYTNPKDKESRIEVKHTESGENDLIEAKTELDLLNSEIENPGYNINENKAFFVLVWYSIIQVKDITLGYILAVLSIVLYTFIKKDLNETNDINKQKSGESIDTLFADGNSQVSEPSPELPINTKVNNSLDKLLNSNYNQWTLRKNLLNTTHILNQTSNSQGQSSSMDIQIPEAFIGRKIENNESEKYLDR